MTGNMLLLGLPAPTYARLKPHLGRVVLPAHWTVIKPGESDGTAYFPESGVFSEIVRLSDGAAVEVNLIGREGLAGLAAYLDAKREPIEVTTLVPGAFLRMSVDVLREVAEQDLDLLHALHKYAQTVLSIRASAIACDRLHPIQARLVRWLLKTRDRAACLEFIFTQDDMALMLGVARPSVTVNALALQEAGLITYRRGRVRILDGPGLENLACECYWNIREEFDRLVPTPLVG